MRARGPEQSTPVPTETPVFRVRRAVYYLVLLALPVVTGWAGTDAAWRAVLVDDVGGSLSVFWDLQIESWATALALAASLDAIYRLRPAPGGGWAAAPRPPSTRVAWALVLLGVALACSAEGATRAVLDVVAPSDIAASVAHTLRRMLEGVLTAIGVLVFLELFAPGPLRGHLGATARVTRAGDGGVRPAGRGR